MNATLETESCQTRFDTPSLINTVQSQGARRLPFACPLCFTAHPARPFCPGPQQSFWQLAGGTAAKHSTQPKQLTQHLGVYERQNELMPRKRALLASPSVRPAATRPGPGLLQPSPRQGQPRLTRGGIRVRASRRRGAATGGRVSGLRRRQARRPSPG